MYNLFKRKTILIIGGTGSIGQVLAEKLLECEPGKIIIFSRRDHDQKEMMIKFNYNPILRFIIGDVKDYDSVNRVMQGVDYVIHTAALKHIELGEINPIEYKSVIVDGTQNVLLAASHNNVKRVIVLSTDKACSPVSLYGASKLMSDRLSLSANKLYNPNTLVSVIRYGNVIGSRGSIVDLMKDKPSTINITHEEMTRFFITKNYAADLIIHLLTYMQGGEILIPKIPSAKIIDMLKYNAQKNAKVNVIGMRCHEKIHESMFSVEDCVTVLEFTNYYLQFLNIPTREQKCFAGEEGKQFKPFEYCSASYLTKDIKSLYNYSKEL